MISVRITDKAFPALQELAADIRNVRPMLTASSRGVANLLRDHFTELDASRPNKMGWERQHFWSDVRGTVQNPFVSVDFATVDITHVALRQKVEGGTIEPVNAQNLTLPAREEAYGKRAREFSDLKFGFARDPQTGRMRSALVQAEQTQINWREKRRKGAQPSDYARTIGGEPFFWLVKRVTQAPVDGAMPTDSDITFAATDAADDWMQARVDRIKE